jgi:mannosyltransferase OCH1-like enzyme
MSGAGYDIAKEQKESELRWAKLEHAVNLALNYFKRRPVPSDQADYVRAFVLERA